MAMTPSPLPHDPTRPPTCPWRGLLVDSARTFWTVPVMELIITVMDRQRRLAPPRPRLPRAHIHRGSDSKSPKRLVRSRVRARTVRHMAHVARAHITRLLFRRKYSTPRPLRRTARHPHHPRDLNPLPRRCRDPSVPTLGKPRPRPCAQTGTQHDVMAQRRVSPIHRGIPPPRVRPIPIPHHSHRHTHNRVEPVGKRPRAQARRPDVWTRHRTLIYRTSDAHTSLPRSPGSHLGHGDSHLRLPTPGDNPSLITLRRITRHRCRLVGSPLDSGRLTPPHPRPPHPPQLTHRISYDRTPALRTATSGTTQRASQGDRSCRMVYIGHDPRPPLLPSAPPAPRHRRNRMARRPHPPMGTTCPAH